MATMKTEEIWQQFHSKLSRFIEKRVPDRAASQDILQDVFVKIHQKAPTLSAVNNVQAWLYKVTYNQIVDHYRKLKTGKSLTEDLPTISDEQQEHQDLAKCMIPFVNKLPVKYKTALLKTDLGGASQIEYANEAGISYTGAKSRVQRARKQLKDLFTDCCTIHVDKYGTVMDYYSNKR